VFQDKRFVEEISALERKVMCQTYYKFLNTVIIILKDIECKTSSHLLITKTNGPNSLSKNALREEVCPWLINFTSQKNPSNVGLLDILRDDIREYIVVHNYLILEQNI
jgi:hypothetical protein